MENLILDSVGISTHVISNNRAITHSHGYYEISYVLSGSVTHIFEKETVCLQVGECVLLSPERVHRVEGKGESVNRDIMIARPLMEALCAVASFPLQSIGSGEKVAVFSFNVEELERLERRVKEFALEQGIPSKRCKGAKVILEILDKAMQGKVEEKALSPIVKKVVECLNKPRFVKGGVKSVCEYLNYSNAHVSHVFKADMGISITQYVKDVRLQHLAYYLHNTDYQLKQICERVGFRSVSYATRSFTEKYGVSPIKYRRQNKY